jgi:hypothetical protein
LWLAWDVGFFLAQGRGLLGAILLVAPSYMAVLAWRARQR